MWSGTDYSGNTSGFSKNGSLTLSSSDEKCAIGFKSLKVEQTADGNSSIRIDKELTTNPTSVYASCRILPKADAVFTIIQYNSDTELTRESVNISSSDEWQNVFVTDSIEENCNKLRVGINLHHMAGEIYYIDDVTLKVQ